MSPFSPPQPLATQALSRGGKPSPGQSSSEVHMPVWRLPVHEPSICPRAVTWDTPGCWSPLNSPMVYVYRCHECLWLGSPYRRGCGCSRWLHSVRPPWPTLGLNLVAREELGIIQLEVWWEMYKYPISQRSSNLNLCHPALPYHHIHLECCLFCFSSFFGGHAAQLAGSQFSGQELNLGHGSESPPS